MDCFGEFIKSRECCKNCEYKDACKWYKENEKREARSNNRHYRDKWGRSYVDEMDTTDENKRREYMYGIVDVIETEDSYSRDDMLRVIQLMVSIMNEDTLRLILTKRLQSNVNIAEIARDVGVSRQTMHARLRRDFQKIFKIGLMDDEKSKIYFDREG